MEVKFNAGDMCAIPDGCKATIKDGIVIFEKDFEDGDVLHSVHDDLNIDLALEILPNIDWEQRRYEIAREAMNGFISAPVVDGVNPNPSFKDIATFSVRLADALIKELKGGTK